MPAEKKTRKSAATTIGNARRSLRMDMEKWRSAQLRVMPSVAGSEEELASGESEMEHAEDEVLGLPSDFTEDDRRRLKLGVSADIEKRLLEGLAHDALSDLREQLKHNKAKLQQKDEEVRGQGANTRAQTILKTAKGISVAHANRYNFIRSRLLRLGLAESDVIFKHLDTKKELWMHSIHKSRMQRSDHPEPWFWNIEEALGATSQEMEQHKIESTYY